MNYFISSFPSCVCACSNVKLQNLCLLLVFLPQTAQHILRAWTKDPTFLKSGHFPTTPAKQGYKSAQVSQAAFLKASSGYTNSLFWATMHWNERLNIESYIFAAWIRIFLGNTESVVHSYNT